MKAVLLAFTQILALLSPIVGATLVTCTFLLTSFLLLVIVYHPDGTRRLVDFLREIQQLSSFKRTHNRRRSPCGRQERERQQ